MSTRARRSTKRSANSRRPDIRSSLPFLGLSSWQNSQTNANPSSTSQEAAWQSLEDDWNSSEDQSIINILEDEIINSDLWPPSTSTSENRSDSQRQASTQLTSFAADWQHQQLRNTQQRQQQPEILDEDHDNISHTNDSPASPSVESLTSNTTSQQRPQETSEEPRSSRSQISSEINRRIHPVNLAEELVEEELFQELRRRAVPLSESQENSNNTNNTSQPTSPQNSNVRQNETDSSTENEPRRLKRPRNDDFDDFDDDDEDFSEIQNILANPPKERSGSTDLSALETLECPICYEQPDIAVAMPCGHLYCSDCAANVVGYNPRCSICRKPVKLTDIRYLEFKLLV